MEPLNITEIAARIKAVVTRPNPVIFAGAGVGRRVGLPDWIRYIEHLAAACDTNSDPTSAALIRDRAGRGNLLGAATVFKTSDRIPEGERWKLLARPFNVSFSREQLERLEPLVNSGFTAIITTNYDHSLHDARAQATRVWFSPVERHDDTLRGAMFRRDFFIARIHGRVDLPTTMVVDTQDYAVLATEDEYLDFLLDVLKFRTCLFVGFSFLDPAISLILTIYEAKVGPTFDALHAALVPADAEALSARLRSLNIEVIPYSTADDHIDLWRGLRQFADERRASPDAARPTLIPPTGASLHRFMAFAYAQVQAATQRHPIATLVQDGIVAAAVAGQEGAEVTEPSIRAIIRPMLRLSEEEASRIVSISLTRLAAGGHLSLRDGVVVQLKTPTNVFDSHLSTLAEGAADRARVREHVAAGQNELAGLKRTIEDALLSRAWDLAAHYAGSAAGYGADVRQAMDRIIANQMSATPERTRHALSRAVADMLMTPHDNEAKLLATLSRAAFGLQLISATPRQALFRKFALPQRLYLDANILMPTITAGHPLRPVYRDILSRLSEAASIADAPLEVVVSQQFLNEVVTHRSRARDLVTELGLEDPDKLSRHVLFYDAINTNVFVGAYATSIGRERHDVPFDRFLSEAAPYTTEAELAAYVKGCGIQAVEIRASVHHEAVYFGVYNRLLSGYESPFDGTLNKVRVLVKHEAEQLAQLRVDAKGGHRSVFVTADGQLRRILQQDPQFHDLAGTTVSQVGLMALADVMVGLEADDRALARLVWVAPFNDEQQALFEYFVRLGLQDYQEGMALEMQETARKVAEQGSLEAAEQNINILGRKEEDIAATAKFLDRYQENFFKNWREAIERRERQNRH